MVFLPRNVEHTYEPYGGAKDLLFSRYPEVLIEGPAGTGKSRAVGEKLFAYANEFPDCRILVVRKTRKSLTDSWLVTWEEHVLWPQHECMQRQISRAGRRSYDFSNGSTVVLGGMDQPTRLFSSQYDVCFVNEATELTEAEFESLHRALRNNKGPYHQLIADCNPDAEAHWLNRRADSFVCLECKSIGMEGTCTRCGGKTKPQMHRILSRHWENPSLTDDYLERLETNLTGIRKERLWFGRWVSAEGQIFEEWDAQKHLINFESWDEEKEEVVFDGHPRDEKGRLRCDWYFGAVDWGFRDPGVFQVWGVYDQALYLVAEVYHTKRQIEWWADVAEKFHDEFYLRRIVCDPSRPDNIEALNHRLGYRAKREADVIAIKANNAIEAGWDVVRWGLNPSAHISVRPDDPPRGVIAGEPLLFVCRDNLRFGLDPELVHSNKLVGFAQEIPSYVYEKREDGKTARRDKKELPDPDCADHSMDAARYAAMWAWGKDLKDPPPTPRVQPGTWADVLDHKKTWAKSKGWYPGKKDREEEW